MNVSIEGRNYYELLGVDRTATTEQIKEAYHERARLYHPDSNFYSEIIETGLSPEELAKFQAITAAYTTLANKSKRADYDTTLPPELQGWDDSPEEVTPPPTRTKNEIPEPVVARERQPGAISRHLVEEVVRESAAYEVEEESWFIPIAIAIVAGLAIGITLLLMYR